MTNKELSQAIRKELKKNGLTSKEVSVKVHDALYDTAADLTVKSPFVRTSEVEEIVKKFSKIDYDRRSMEILSGCNVYVHVQYAYGIFQDVSAPLVTIARNVFNNPEYDGRKIAQNEDTEVHIIKMNDTESRLYEFDRSEKQHSYLSGYIVKSVEGLAVAMWRFKNLGTIYA